MVNPEPRLALSEAGNVGSVPNSLQNETEALTEACEYLVADLETSLDPWWYFGETLSLVSSATLLSIRGVHPRVPVEYVGSVDDTWDALTAEITGKLARDLAKTSGGSSKLGHFIRAARKATADPATCASLVSRRRQIEESLARTRTEAREMLRNLDVALFTPAAECDFEADEEEPRDEDSKDEPRFSRRAHISTDDLTVDPALQSDSEPEGGTPLDLISQLSTVRESIRSGNSEASWAERSEYLGWLTAIHSHMQLEQRHPLVPTLYSLYVPRQQRPAVAQAVESVIAECASHPKSILKLKPREFELLVARLFEAQKYSVEVTSETRDGGADVICMKNDHGVKFKVAVEVKRYDPCRPVGVELIRSFVGANAQFLANKLVYVSTSGYTRDALSFARTPGVMHMLELKSLPDVVEWASHAFPGPARDTSPISDPPIR
jgi:hypothetical protein